jgi:SpoVK/Ycf46/Vps4 family AAA+-type ATPase
MLRRFLRGSTTPTEDESASWTVIEDLAAISDGFSGADLRAICDDARILALRDAAYRVGARVAPNHLGRAFEAQQQQQRDPALLRPEVRHTAAAREWSVDEVV